MFKLKKNKNIVLSLRDREIYLVPSARKASCNILCQYICSKSSTFRQAWRHKCRTPVYCEDGKLYLHHYTECYSLWGPGDSPSISYKLKHGRARRKIIDPVIASQRSTADASTSFHAQRPLTYRGAFIGLTDDNYLCAYDHEKGVLMQEIYLGDPKCICKFKHCDWETFPTQITVMCILGRTSHNENGPEQPLTMIDRTDVVSVVAVFTLFPLEFKALMTIDESVFGPKCRKVNISEGTLIVGIGESADSEVHIYNFYKMLDSCILFSVKLGEPCADLNDRLVGSYPAGLPINCKVKEAPPILFRVRCNDYVVDFGLSPFHYMIMLPKMSVYQLRRLSDDQIPQRGLFFPSEQCFEVERANFHYDDSNRIIFHTAHEIRMFGFSTGLSSSPSSIVQLFSMNFIPERATGQVKRSSSLRQIARRSYVSSSRSVMCMDYDNELDLIVVLGYNPEDACCRAKLNMHDNSTGRTIKTVDLGVGLNDLLDYDLTFHLDTVVIAERLRNSYCLCRVYKLISEEAVSMGSDTVRTRYVATCAQPFSRRRYPAV